MATIVETKNLADLYDFPLVDWAAVTAPLDQGVTQAPGPSLLRRLPAGPIVGVNRYDFVRPTVSCRLKGLFATGIRAPSLASVP
jgi:hypothetical protein